MLPNYYLLLALLLLELVLVDVISGTANFSAEFSDPSPHTIIISPKQDAFFPLQDAANTTTVRILVITGESCD